MNLWFALSASNSPKHLSLAMRPNVGHGSVQFSASRQMYAVFQTTFIHEYEVVNAIGGETFGERREVPSQPVMRIDAAYASASWRGSAKCQAAIRKRFDAERPSKAISGRLPLARAEPKFDRIVCFHMYGLSVRSYMTAVQGDCPEFRVWRGTMGKNETQHVPTQKTRDTEGHFRPTACQH